MTKSGSIKVVDSWAIIAWINDEPPAGAVEEILKQADAGGVRLLMSRLNVAETYYVLAKRHSPSLADSFLERLPSLPIHVVLPDDDGIMLAARIKAAHPIAFGDAFAIALAQDHGASVITGDDEIRKCGLVPVDWIGSKI